MYIQEGTWGFDNLEKKWWGVQSADIKRSDWPGEDSKANVADEGTILTQKKNDGVELLFIQSLAVKDRLPFLLNASSPLMSA